MLAPGLGSLDELDEEGHVSQDNFPTHSRPSGPDPKLAVTIWAGT